MSCSRRVDIEEFLDDAGLSLEAARVTLRDQALVNRWLGGTSATLTHVLPMLDACASDPVRLLDMACGRADLSRAIVDRARVRGIHTEVTALDLNDRVLTCAREMSSAYPEITLIQADALDPPFERGDFDLVMMSTFMHHLPPERVIAALRVAKNLSRGAVIVTDLVRSAAAYLGFAAFAGLAGFSPVSLHDGKASICRAYTPLELSELARQAGLEPHRISKHRFFRMTLVYRAACPQDTV